MDSTTPPIRRGCGVSPRAWRGCLVQWFSMGVVQQPSEDIAVRGRAWALAVGDRVPRDPEEHCSTRDVFTARLDHARIVLERAPALHTITPEFIAAVGEIGNNAFDHNIGQWRDVPGCWFAWVARASEVIAVVGDRGQGVLATLRRVRPELRDDAEAVRVAFHEVISGRSPEQRGNGLKFVASVVRRSGNRSLDFASGAALVRLTTRSGNLHEEWVMSEPAIPGTLAVLTVRV